MKKVTYHATRHRFIVQGQGARANVNALVCLITKNSDSDARLLFSSFDDRRPPSMMYN